MSFLQIAGVGNLNDISHVCVCVCVWGGGATLDRLGVKMLAIGLFINDKKVQKDKVTLKPF